jgi:hypothetical protein
MTPGDLLIARFFFRSDLLQPSKPTIEDETSATGNATKIVSGADFPADKCEGWMAVSDLSASAEIRPHKNDLIKEETTECSRT